MLCILFILLYDCLVLAVLCNKCIPSYLVRTLRSQVPELAPANKIVLQIRGLITGATGPLTGFLFTYVY